MINDMKYDNAVHEREIHTQQDHTGNENGKKKTQKTFDEKEKTGKKEPKKSRSEDCCEKARKEDCDCAHPDCTWDCGERVEWTRRWQRESSIGGSGKDARGVRAEGCGSLRRPEE